MECPYCKEDIKDGAIKCKHCGSMLSEVKIEKVTPAASVADEEKVFYADEEKSILVSSSRFTVPKVTYPLNTISSVRLRSWITKENFNIFGTLLISTSAIVILGLFVKVISTYQSDPGALLFADFDDIFSEMEKVILGVGTIMGFASMLFKKKHHHHSVNIRTGSRELEVLKSANENDIQEVVDALNNAIMHKG